jgi:transcriptional regulator with XRE-family HTH domain
MISVYERGRREPSLATLLKLLHAAGFELTMQLAPHDRHDEVLDALESRRSTSERRRRDRQVDAWRRATPIEAA